MNTLLIMDHDGGRLESYWRSFARDDEAGNVTICFNGPPWTERTQWSYLTRPDVICRSLRPGDSLHVRLQCETGELAFAGFLREIDVTLVGVGRWGVGLVLRPMPTS